MEKLDIKEIQKKDYKANPLLVDIPDSLKDPKCFIDVENKLRKMVLSDHKHETIKGYMKCKRCKDKLEKRRAYMKEIGFKDVKVYSEWKRIMQIIRQQRNIILR